MLVTLLTDVWLWHFLNFLFAPSKRCREGDACLSANNFSKIATDSSGSCAGRSAVTVRRRGIKEQRTFKFEEFRNALDLEIRRRIHVKEWDDAPTA